MSSVDVIVPCYNYARFLRQCVESVLRQEGVQVRVLIIDDASTDDTEAVGRQLAAEDARVEYRRHAVNRGHIETYNEGLLGWAAGDYCLLLSADDLLTPGALARSTRLLDSYPGVGFVYGRGIKTKDPDAIPYDHRHEFATSVTPGAKFFRSICETSENIVDTATVVVRTRLQQQVGGYRKELPHAGDMEMWLRLALHAAVGYVDAEQAYYRLHGQNMSEGYRQVSDAQQRKEVFDQLFTQFHERISDCHSLQKQTNAALALSALWTGSESFERGDRQTCKALLAFALEVEPRLKFRAVWWRLLVKRMLGANLSSRLRQLLRRPGLPTTGAPLEAAASAAHWANEHLSASCREAAAPDGGKSLVDRR
jgi:GT2 family glycosyltransferase